MDAAAAQAAGETALLRLVLFALATVPVAMAASMWDATLLPALERLMEGLEPVEVAAVVAVVAVVINSLGFYMMVGGDWKKKLGW